MIDILRACQKIITELRTQIQSTQSYHINREADKKAVRQVVDGYFRTNRPILLKHFGQEEPFMSLDEAMQKLLRFTHSRTPKGKYLSALTQIKRGWCNLEVQSIPLCQDKTGGENESPTPIEHSILDGLTSLYPPAAACYRQALNDLRDSHRLSWRGTVTELRETLREVLDHLAPDEKVKETPSFKLEDGAKGPTMKQKVRFIQRMRRSSNGAEKSLEDAVDFVEEKFGNLVRSVYGRSCGSVHTLTGKNEVMAIKRLVETVLAELLPPTDSTQFACAA
jgi:hypothetical protein